VTTPNGTARRAPADQFAYNPPKATSILRQTPFAEWTTDTEVVYRVTFSENVTGVSTGAFTLTTVWATPADRSPQSLRRQRHDLRRDREQPSGGAGRLRLDLKSSGTGITGAAGNASRAVFTHGQTFHEVC